MSFVYLLPLTLHASYVANKSSRIVACTQTTRPRKCTNSAPLRTDPIEAGRASVRNRSEARWWTIRLSERRTPTTTTFTLLNRVESHCRLVLVKLSDAKISIQLSTTLLHGNERERDQWLTGCGASLFKLPQYSHSTPLSTFQTQTSNHLLLFIADGERSLFVASRHLERTQWEPLTIFTLDLKSEARGQNFSTLHPGFFAVGSYSSCPLTYTFMILIASFIVNY